VAQVQALGLAPATIAVVDRVGNILAVFQCRARRPTSITSQRGVDGVEGLAVQHAGGDQQGRLLRPISSQGNAF
jgi:hypothetical protein